MASSKHKKSPSQLEVLTWFQTCKTHICAYMRSPRFFSKWEAKTGHVYTVVERDGNKWESVTSDCFLRESTHCQKHSVQDVVTHCHLPGDLSPSWGTTGGKGCDSCHGCSLPWCLSFLRALSVYFWTQIATSKLVGQMHCLILYDILLTSNPVCREPEELTLIGSEKEKGMTDTQDWSLHHPAAFAPSQQAHCSIWAGFRN